MVTAVALILSIASIMFSLVMLARLRRLEGTIGRRREPVLAPGPALQSPNVLESLRVYIDVRQDCVSPVVQNVIAEVLEKRDARVVSHAQQAEIVIQGDVDCNGYEDVYYHANISVLARGQQLGCINEKPVAGDRPMNLALEVVSVLTKALTDQTLRQERRSALEELGRP